MKDTTNRKLHLRHRPLDAIFVIVLLCVFTFGSLMLVIVGANIYGNITDNMDNNFQHRTTLSYISTKIRQNDAADAVSIVEKEGIHALVLKTLDGNEAAETWIYEYDNALYEIYINEGSSFQLSDGLPIIPSYGLDMKIEDTLLQLSTLDQDGQSRVLRISLRSTQGGELL